MLMASCVTTPAQVKAIALACIADTVGEIKESLGLDVLMGGDTLPADITEPVEVQTDSGPVTVNPGDTLPADMIGVVVVDGSGEPGEAAYVPAFVESCCPGPEVCVTDGTTKLLRRLVDKADAAAGYEWFDEAGVAVPPPADPSLFTPCPTGAYTGCEGDIPFGSRILTPSDGHLFSATTAPAISIPTGDCVPDAPECVDIPSTRVVDGVMFEWQPDKARWVVVMFTPKSRADRAFGPTTQLVDADLQAFAGQGIQILQNATDVITNDDCVPWEVTAYASIQWQPTISADSFTAFGLLVNAADDFQWPANDWGEEYDTREFVENANGGAAIRKWQDRNPMLLTSRPNNPVNAGRPILLPGQSMTVSIDAYVNVREYNLPDPDSTLSFSSFVVWWDARRSMPA